MKSLAASVCFLLTLSITFRPEFLPADETVDSEFDRHVAPLLAARCLECHSGSEPKGGLDLSREQTALKGGESGAAIAAGKPGDSLLWEFVSSDQMPPKHPLSDDEKQTLRHWIENGAKWGTNPIDRFRYTTESRAGYDWWSLQPLKNIKPPTSDKDQWSRNDIDRFVLRKLNEKSLSPSNEASARTLIRRLYFDLTGLPPTPEEVAAFVKAPTEEAYRSLVDQLLDSPQYGERWGRHWLDVVRYGESNGFERNAPRKNFWYYRDWIIKALNDDMPYDEFVRMQLIGDLLKPGPEGTASIGFMVAGVHNTVVGGSERMKKLARQDELEEVIGTLGQTFLGLTVQCGRCHDHKFDPILQKEYYRLISSISGMNHGERVERTPEERKRLDEFSARIGGISQQLAEIDQRARTAILAARKKGDVEIPKPPQAYARWEFDGNLNDSADKMHGKQTKSTKIEAGALIVNNKSFVETPPIDREIREKTLEAWAQLDNLDQRGGGSISIETANGSVFDAIVFGEREPKHWMAGSNGFVRTQSFHGTEEAEATKRPVHFAIVYAADGTITGYRDGKPYGKPYKSSGLQTFKAGTAHIAFGLRHKPAGSNKHLSGRILKASLYDRALDPGEIAASAGSSTDYVSEEAIVKWLPETERTKRSSLKKQLADLGQQRKSLEDSTNRNMYTMNAGNPGMTRLLIRGDIEKESDVVSPAGVASVVGVNAEFELKPDAPDADRRRKLSEWITSPNNPIFARVIVNRVWHYHFGTGIVDTPNDLGFNGGRPSHPELIDWLAEWFRDNGYRLKDLHRLLVTSSTYRQQSAPNQKAQQIDAENRLLWRMSPRRLEAEAVRDAMLVVSGKLNPQIGGPSFEDVSITNNNGTTYYEPIEVDGPAFFRRTVYRFAPRGGRSALLDTFDCPDPSATAPRRAVTTTPLQALSLLNNVFVLQMSNYFADRISAESGDDTTAQINRAWLLAVARSPTESERKLSLALTSKHGMAALCRGLFNASEFVIVE